MATTRAALRRSIGRLLGDVLVLRATAAGTTATVIDAVNAAPDGTLAGRIAYASAVAAPANAGLQRRVTGNARATGTVTLAPALPVATSSGDEFEVWNERGVGVTPDEVHEAINRAIAAVAHVALEPALSVAAGFSRSSPAVAVPAGWSHYSGAEWLDADGTWRPVPVADVRRDPAARTVTLRNRALLAADGSQVRLRGWVPAQPLATDLDETEVDPEWLAYHVAGEVLMAAAHRAHVSGEALARAQWFRDKADGLRPKTRTRVPLGPLHRLY